MSTYSYRLTISYCGYGLEGWQVQTRTNKTVQGILNLALKKISKSEKIRTIGSGRTDSGVHAFKQVCRADIELEIESDSLQKALNSKLPEQIRVLKCETCSIDFHPIYNAQWKRYEYYYYCDELLPPTMQSIVTHLRRPIDLSLMIEASKALIGEHDFENFSTKGTAVSTTVRTLYDIKIEYLLEKSIFSGAQQGQMLKLTFEGSGFLKQMVRLLVGALVAAGHSKISKEEIQKYLKIKTDSKIAPTAPATGLYLAHVEYDSAHRMA